MPNPTCHNLPVYTISGRHIGKVIDVEIDSTTQGVVNYHVVAATPLPGLWHGRLVIHRTQVVSVSEEQLTVQETAQPLKETAPASLVAGPT
jgi:sporulation protein YlmC with PRC-barrel domain